MPSRYEQLKTEDKTIVDAMVFNRLSEMMQEAVGAADYVNPPGPVLIQKMREDVSVIAESTIGVSRRGWQLKGEKHIEKAMREQRDWTSGKNGSPEIMRPAIDMLDHLPHDYTMPLQL